jgi:putative addiction module component (TIGR02574 family)
MSAQLAPIFDLSRAEKLQHADEQWDSIAEEDPQQPSQPLARWKADELIRRTKAFEKDPTNAQTCEQVKARIMIERLASKTLYDTALIHQNIAEYFKK